MKAVLAVIFVGAIVGAAFWVPTLYSDAGLRAASIVAPGWEIYTQINAMQFEE